MLNQIFTTSFWPFLIGMAVVLGLIWLWFGRAIDAILNRITMYRLLLYYLIFLLAIALVLSAAHILVFSPLQLLLSIAVITIVSWLTNKAIARFLNIPTNIDSVFITALILALIISPPTAGLFSNIGFLMWAAILSQASKYILNIFRKHIFNPAALAVAITSFTKGSSASWWVGTHSMLIFVLIGGLLVIRKVQRFDAVIAFSAAAVLAMAALTSGVPLTTIQKAVLDSPLIFFAAVMLTEPLTMPPTRDGRLAYGVLVGALFAPQFHIAGYAFTPEQALLAGNIFSYIISPKYRYMLTLREKKQAAKGVYDFVFEGAGPMNFRPGQYMEWTLPHARPDSRGNRRYFTIASSPAEQHVLLGVKFYDQPSTYKQAMLSMNPGDKIAAGQLAGDFTLPDDHSKKLAFIAGGIGVTPFRSMIRHLLDSKQPRPITMLYSNRSADEIAYADVFMQAKQQLNINTVYTLTDMIPDDWMGYRGYINADMVAKEIPDYRERTFYISGSNTMVKACKDTLLKMGVPRTRIKTDFFPGLA